MVGDFKKKLQTNTYQLLKVAIEIIIKRQFDE
jgi:hypothetical protein